MIAILIGAFEQIVQPSRPRGTGLDINTVAIYWNVILAAFSAVRVGIWTRDTHQEVGHQRMSRSSDPQSIVRLIR